MNHRLPDPLPAAHIQRLLGQTGLFTELKDTEALREACHAQASALSLKGTVLIAEEGINLF